MAADKREKRARKRDERRGRVESSRDGRSDRRSRSSAEVVEGEFVAAMRHLIAERWGAVWKAVPAALEGVDIEGVHDVRVASRRLRAAMDVAVDCFPAEWYRPLHKTAKEITGALGEVRDRDVLLAALASRREAATEPERPGIDRLIARIERERVAARAEMEHFLTGLIEGETARETARRFGPTGPPPAEPARGEAKG